MKCKDSRKITYISEYPHVVTEDMLEAKRHLNECRECREFIDGERAFSSMVRGAVKKESVPLELKDKILSIETHRKGHLKKINKIFAVAAAIMLLVTAGYFVLMQKKSPSILDKIVSDHVKFLPSPQTQISTANPDEIKAWFRGRVDFSALPPYMNATLKGGRLCILDKKHFALLFYEYNNTPVSLFITDGKIMDEIKSKKEVALKGRRLYVEQKNGYSIVFWKEKGLVYALVSELDLNEIKKVL